MFNLIEITIKLPKLYLKNIYFPKKKNKKKNRILNIKKFNLYTYIIKK